MTTDFFWQRTVLWLALPLSETSNWLIGEVLFLALLFVLTVTVALLVFRRQKHRRAQQGSGGAARSESLAALPETKPPAPGTEAAPDVQPVPAVRPPEPTRVQSPIPEPQPTPSPSAKPAPTPRASWTGALAKSREPFLRRLQDAISSAVSGKAPWGPDHPLWEALEEVLIYSDLGPRLTQTLLNQLKADFREAPDLEHLKEALRKKMIEVLESAPTRDVAVAVGPRVTVLVGVNGSGKTTTTGKLAYQAKQAGRTAVVGAGDTFRAAAVEQLQAWAERIGVECITPAKGANPAAVAFDTVAAGIAREADEIILDTAGRLHTKESLMEELKKVVNVIKKKIPTAPHRVLLVLDSTLGQNALAQAREFLAAVNATGVVLTKLDGSAKGGAALAVVAELGLPVEYVGLGEGPDDLRPFSPQEFVQNLV